MGLFLLRKGSETLCADSGSASPEQRAESLAYRQSINQRSQSQRQRTRGEEGGQSGKREVHQLLLKLKASHWRQGENQDSSPFLVIICLSPTLSLNVISKVWSRASLGVQWLKIHLPMQGTWIQSLLWEDLTFCGASKPMNHNY